MKQVELELKNDQNIWFTSDLHFLHKNISGPKRSTWTSGYRTFDDEDIMTDYLIKSINNLVKEDDVLFNLGDFVFKDHKKIPELRQQINCKNLYHILGNHDGHILKYKNEFTLVDSLIGLKIKQNEKILNFVLCHYAMRVWDGNNKGTYHLYGHTHNYLEQEPWGKSMDVGVDASKAIFDDYKPFSLEEVLSILNKREIK